LAAAVLPVLAQEKQEAPVSTYKVEFRLRDGSETAAKNGRTYVIWINSQKRSYIRVGERVPVAMDPVQPGTSGAGPTPIANRQISYMDLGVNIDASVTEHGSKVTLDANIDVSLLVSHHEGVQVLPQPSVSQIRINVTTAVPLGKPSLVASINDPVTQRKFEVEALVTKLE
jgi:hypothetical protein